MWQESCKSIPELETPRLRLRAIGMADTDAFFDIYSDAETLRYWSGAPISNLSEAEDLLRKELEWSIKGQCINWGIALPSSNRLIGKFTLFQYSEQNRRAEVGYILNRRYWGQAYMSEVMKCALDFAFDVLQ